MIGDPWPEEPDDPYADLARPEENVAVDVPSSDDVPRELFRAFLGLVAVFNVGLFASSLGVLLIAFRGEWTFGGATLLVGLLALAYGRHRYHVYRADPPWID